MTRRQAMTGASSRKSRKPAPTDAAASTSQDVERHAGSRATRRTTTLGTRTSTTIGMNQAPVIASAGTCSLPITPEKKAIPSATAPTSPTAMSAATSQAVHVGSHPMTASCASASPVTSSAAGTVP